jgi:Na+-translocating ferredoxin:NAD+ oxidoreductase RnfE subunit
MTLGLPTGGMLVAILPPGAFFGMGLLLALRNRLTAKPRNDQSSSGMPR